MPIKEIVVKLYQCTCGEKYRDRQEAEACMAGEEGKPRLKVGDVVTAGSGRFGWYDGDARWIATGTPNTRMPAGKLMGFYYVVTHVERESHRNKYHLVTLAMSAKSGYRRGYTFDTGHIYAVKVRNPPKLPNITKAKKERATSLL